MTGTDWFWISGGRLVREIAEWDVLGVLRQIGLVPGDGGRGLPPAVPAPPRGPATAEDPERNAATARRPFAELLSSGADIGGVCAEDAWFLDPGAPAPITGRATTEFAGLVRRTFPDLRHGVTGVLAEADRVVVRSATTGTRTGDGLIPGLPPTGHRIDATGVGWMLFRDGLVVEERSEWDVHRALGQLGMIPPPQAGRPGRAAPRPPRRGAGRPRGRDPRPDGVPADARAPTGRTPSAPPGTPRPGHPGVRTRPCPTRCRPRRSRLVP